jgi:hypothetical protein
MSTDQGLVSVSSTNNIPQKEEPELAQYTGETSSAMICNIFELNPPTQRLSKSNSVQYEQRKMSW